MRYYGVERDTGSEINCEKSYCFLSSTVLYLVKEMKIPNSKEVFEADLLSQPVVCIHLLAGL